MFFHFYILAENIVAPKKIKLKLKFKVTVPVDLTNPDVYMEVKTQALLQVKFSRIMRNPVYKVRVLTRLRTVCWAIESIEMMEFRI